MKTTPTLIHGIADYVMAALLLLSPWLFGFVHDAAATSCTMLFGLAMLVYGAFTDYELSIRRIIPMPVHLLFDAVSGGLLIGAPFMMGFAATSWVPHLVLGTVEVAFAIASALVLGVLRIADWRQHPRRRRATH